MLTFSAVPAASALAVGLKALGEPLCNRVVRLPWLSAVATARRKVDLTLRKSGTSLLSTPLFLQASLAPEVGVSGHGT